MHVTELVVKVLTASCRSLFELVSLDKLPAATPWWGVLIARCINLLAVLALAKIILK